MLFLAASLPSRARREIPRPPRREPLRENNRSLFDLFLDETYSWETLDEEHKTLAVQILARLLVQAARGREQKGDSHE